MSQIDPTRARQGRKGSRVLIILIAALALALIGGLGMGLFGASEPDENIGSPEAGDVSTAPAAPAGAGGAASPTVTPSTGSPNTQ